MEEFQRARLPIRFGIFEVDVHAGELRRQNRKVRLQEQPFRLLIILLENAGNVVSREELQKQLWPADTFVDFERGVNRAVNKLREALGDDADRPRFIETLPRRGYRFLAAVELGTAEEARTTGRTRLELVQPDAQHEPVADIAAAAIPWRKILLWTGVSALVVLALLGYVKLWHGLTKKPDRPLLKFDLAVGPDEFSQPAISPDGMRMVLVSQGFLAVRRFDQTKTTRLSGTEGAFLPFFSPDGRWVAFFAGGKLQKIAIEGGIPVVLCDAPNPGGGSWGDDNNIVAVLNASREGPSGLSRIAAAGGEPQQLTNPRLDPSGALMHLWPQALPGGKAVLFVAADGSGHRAVRVLMLQSGTIKTLVENASDGHYLPSGYLIYRRRSTLYSAPMDVMRLNVAGPPMVLVPGVANPGGRAEFDVSNSGTLVYRGGGAGKRFALTWLYPSGLTERSFREPGSFLTPRLSPDGTRLATAWNEDGRQNIWVYEFGRGTWTRLTSDVAPALLPTWTPDGQFLAFRWGNTLAWARSDGSGGVQHLEGVGANVGPWSFSADGKWLSFWPLEPGSDLWAAPVTRTKDALRLGRPQRITQGAGSQGAPAISPDNRWVAYSSDESGRFEIYVRPFLPARPGAGGKWPISSEGGLSPVWSRNGKELFFQSLNRHVEVAAYSVRGESFLAEKPRAWCLTRLADTGTFHAFDIAPDGKRVLALLDSDEATPEPTLHVLLNLDDELRRRAATKSR